MPTLFLPAGQLRRVGLVLVLQTHQLQQFTHLPLALQLGHAGHFQRQLDVLPHGLGRHQVEVLEDHADAPTQRYKVVFVEVADVHLIDQHPPAAGLLQAVDGADQRGLTGAAAADDAEHLTALNRQVDALQGLYFAVVALAQVDEAHVGAVQVRVQFCLLGVPGRCAQVAQLRVGGGHFLASQPTW